MTGLKKLRQRWFSLDTQLRISIVFLFVLAFVISGASYFFAAAAINRATHNAASLEQLCLSGNEFRRDQITLWNFIIDISPPPPHETAAERATREAQLIRFEKYLHHVFALRNCAASFPTASG